MPKSQLSVRAQTGLVFGVLLFFSVALTIGGIAGSGQTSDKMAAFSSDGATVTGTVTNKYIHVVTKVWVYWLDVRFKTRDGVVQRHSTQVANTVFDRLEIGGPVSVTYVKSKPDWFYVEDEAPTERDVGIMNVMAQVGIFGGLLSMVGLLAVFLWKDGSSTPAVRTPASRPAAERHNAGPPLREPSGHPRGTFGTRRN